MSIISKMKANKKFKDVIVDIKGDKNAEQEFYHCGSITLNLLMSGKVNGGIPRGKMSLIASPRAHMKTIIALISASNAQKKGNTVVWLDAEFAFDVKTAEMFGLDCSEEKLILLQDNSIENVQSFVANLFEEYNEKEDGKIFIVLDSLGTMITSKTIEDSIDGKDVADMTISKKKNQFSKMLLRISGMNNITVVIINHLYSCLGGDTLVRTNDTNNPNKKISEITTEDEVLTTQGYQQVLNAFKYDKTRVYEIEFEDGTKVSCTDQHKFLVKNHEYNDNDYRWVKVEELSDGVDIIEYFDGISEKKF